MRYLRLYMCIFGGSCRFHIFSILIRVLLIITTSVIITITTIFMLSYYDSHHQHGSCNETAFIHSASVLEARLLRLAALIDVASLKTILEDCCAGGTSGRWNDFGACHVDMSSCLLDLQEGNLFPWATGFLTGVLCQQPKCLRSGENKWDVFLMALVIMTQISQLVVIHDGVVAVW